MNGSLTEADWNAIRAAKVRLDSPSLTARIADIFGKPIQAGLSYLPADWNEKVRGLAQAALLKALDMAILTLGDVESKGNSNNWLHRILIAGSGVAGGAAGIATLPLELPVSTGIILRSIADIARSEGHNVNRLEVKLSCLEVLAFGGRSSADDGAEEGYWVVRTALARSVSEAAAYIAERGLSEKGAPPLVRFVASIASRFSTVLTEEAAAKAVPVIGAVAGGAINLLFMYHFQEIARGHFVIGRLEKTYGTELIEEAYRQVG
jgi:hypothetical protein